MRAAALITLACLQAAAFSTRPSRAEKIDAAITALAARQFAFLTNKDVSGLVTQFSDDPLITVYDATYGSYTKYDVPGFYDFFFPFAVPEVGELLITPLVFQIYTKEPQLILEAVQLVGRDHFYFIHDVLTMEYNESADRAKFLSLNHMIMERESSLTNKTIGNYVNLPI
mmetsp:Transcript_15392/g.30051  ORF Transcript_15392/g.30051 Transcript_15392/m.30051 type:complete len:170 (-) Transcript_15392:315-824(-)